MGPLLKALRWLGWRVLILAPVAAWAAAGGPFLAPLMWVLFAYILFRALPGIRSDLGRLKRPAVFAGRKSGHRGQGLL